MRVLFVDHDAVRGASLAASLVRDVEVVHVAVDAISAMRRLRVWKPDLLVLRWDLNPFSRGRLVAEAEALRCRLLVIVPDLASVVKAEELGATAVVVASAEAASKPRSVRDHQQALHARLLESLDFEEVGRCSKDELMSLLTGRLTDMAEDVPLSEMERQRMVQEIVDIIVS